MLQWEDYHHQLQYWPSQGRHILAQFDEKSVVVYQAYRAAIGHFAAHHGCFGGDFSYSRMSWIKPNFLWMMYRCGWGCKIDQEVILAVRLRREAFDTILSRAVPTSFQGHLYSSHETWQAAVAESEVRVQWDPDHDPDGACLERRAIQLGMKGKSLSSYGRDWILDIEDISEAVAAQREALRAGRPWPGLRTPREQVYPLADELALRLGVTD